MSVILEVKDLHKSYMDGEKSVEVLKGINLSLEAGQFGAIVGASGAGKSTLLSLIGALLKPDMGEIIVSGDSLSTYYKNGNINMYRKNHIGFIFQNHYLMPDFTILENVMMPLIVQNRNKKESMQMAEEILEKVGILNRKDHYPSQVSGGESQRAAAARAIVKKPSIILADEPTGNLDSVNTEKFINLLRDLQSQEQLTVLVVTHERRLAESAEITFNISDGKII